MMRLKSWSNRLMPGRSSALACGAAGILAAAMAPAALAASAGIQGEVLTYSASPGEANALVISATRKKVRLSDRGAAVSAGRGCTQISATVVECSRKPLSVISFDGDDLDDSVTNKTWIASRLLGGVGDDVLRGGKGADFLRGGVGADFLRGGRGRDSVVTAGAYADRVACGAGRDRVRADIFDSVAGDCESVDLQTGI